MTEVKVKRLKRLASIALDQLIQWLETDKDKDNKDQNKLINKVRIKESEHELENWLTPEMLIEVHKALVDSKSRC